MSHYFPGLIHPKWLAGFLPSTVWTLVFCTPHSLRNSRYKRHLPAHGTTGTFLDTERVTKSSGPCATTEPEVTFQPQKPSNRKKKTGKNRVNYSLLQGINSNPNKLVSFLFQPEGLFFLIVFCLLKKGGIKLWTLNKRASPPWSKLSVTGNQGVMISLYGRKKLVKNLLLYVNPCMIRKYVLNKWWWKIHVWIVNFNISPT